VQQNLLVMFSTASPVWAGLATIASFGASTILGSWIANSMFDREKVQPLQTDDGLYAMRTQRVCRVIVGRSTAPPAQVVAINISVCGCSLADGSGQVARRNLGRSAYSRACVCLGS
jgi:hypothetical protein